MFYLKLLVPCLTPIAHLVLQIAVFHCAIHTSSQRLRLLLFPPFLCFSVLSFTTAKKFNIVPSVASLWTQSIALNIVHVTSVLFIDRLPTPKKGQNQWQALRTSYRVWSNPRLLAVHVEQEHEERRVPKEESRIVFLFLRLAKLTLYSYLHVYVMPSLYSETIFEVLPSEIANPALFSRLDDLTAREVVLRSHTAVAWIWESLVFLDGANAVLAIVFVFARFDQPSDWPSLFGSPIAACGLRAFWSQFWHPLAVRPYTNCGRVVAHAVGLQSTSGVSKAVVAFVVFLLSGVSHAAVSWNLGTRDWLDVHWFFLNFVVCFAEGAAVSATRALARRIGWSKELHLIEKSWLGYVIGYAWVFGFFFWSVPQWRWPRLHRQLTSVDTWMRILSNMTIVPPAREGVHSL